MTKIDVVSGFLGAGKTTFCSRLLSYYLSIGETPVYLVNEFGSTGLDGKVLKSEGFQAFEMEGGCVCCTLKDNFRSALKTIIETYHPSRIVFEPSGIFIFDNILDILKDDFLSTRCTFENIITIVDCKNFYEYPLIAGSFVYNQIRNSPNLILSKLSAQEEQTSNIICDLKNINPDANIIAKNWNELTLEDYSFLASAWNNEINSEKNAHPGLESMTVEIPLIFTKQILFSLRKGIKKGIFGGIIRVKGIVKTETEIMLLNIALNSLSMTPCKSEDKCRITFIGNNINAQKIRALFANF